LKKPHIICIYALAGALLLADYSVATCLQQDDVTTLCLLSVKKVCKVIMQITKTVRVLDMASTSVSIIIISLWEAEAARSQQTQECARSIQTPE